MIALLTEEKKLLVPALLSSSYAGANQLYRPQVISIVFMVECKKNLIMELLWSSLFLFIIFLLQFYAEEKQKEKKIRQKSLS